MWVDLSKLARFILLNLWKWTRYVASLHGPGIGGAGLLIKLVWAWFREKLFHLSLYKYKRTAPLTSSDYSLCFSGCVFPFGALKSLFKIRYLSVGHPLPIVSCRYLFINSNRAENGHTCSLPSLTCSCEVISPDSFIRDSWIGHQETLKLPALGSRKRFLQAPSLR